MFGWLGSIWNSFVGFLSVFWVTFSGVFALLLGAIADPIGAINSLLCRVIDIVAAVWPSTPPALQIGTLLSSIGTAIPLIGAAVVYDLFTTILGMFLIVLAIKLYKLIPFKMS